MHATPTHHSWCYCARLAEVLHICPSLNHNSRLAEVLHICPSLNHNSRQSWFSASTALERVHTMLQRVHTMLQRVHTMLQRGTPQLASTPCPYPLHPTWETSAATSAAHRSGWCERTGNLLPRHPRWSIPAWEKCQRIGSVSRVLPAACRPTLESCMLSHTEKLHAVPHWKAACCPTQENTLGWRRLCQFFYMDTQPTARTKVDVWLSTPTSMTHRGWELLLLPRPTMPPGLLCQGHGACYCTAHVLRGGWCSRPAGRAQAALSFVQTRRAHFRVPLHACAKQHRHASADKARAGGGRSRRFRHSLGRAPSLDRGPALPWPGRTRPDDAALKAAWSAAWRGVQRCAAVPRSLRVGLHGCSSCTHCSATRPNSNVSSAASPLSTSSPRSQPNVFSPEYLMYRKPSLSRISSYTADMSEAARSTDMTIGRRRDGEGVCHFECRACVFACVCKLLRPGKPV
eukprot:363651-Chlamydomonas_euryale.AAC.7